MENCVSGITYYSLVSDYSGDFTKNCGLTAAEIDSNFYFLRGKEIADFYWDGEKSLFVIEKLNGEKLETDSVDKYINDSIVAILSGITETMDEFELELSGISESISGVYDDVDVSINELKDYVNNKIVELNEQRLEDKHELIEMFNSGITEISEQIADINERISGITTVFGNLEEYVNRAISDSEARTEEKLNILDNKINTSVSELSRTEAADKAELQNSISDLSCTVNNLQSDIATVSAKTQDNSERIDELSGNTTMAINGATRTLDGKINILTNELLNTEHSINDRITSVNNDLTESIDGINGKIQTLETVNNDVYEQIDEVKNSVAQLSINTQNEISRVERETNQSVSTINDNINNLSNELTRTENRINSAITENKTEADEKFNQIDTKFEQIDEVNRVQEEKLDSLSGISLSGVTVINEKLNDLEESLNEKIDTSIAQVNTGITKNTHDIAQVNETLLDTINSGDEQLANQISALSENVDEQISGVTAAILDTNDKINSLSSVVSGITGDIAELSGNTITEYINIIVSGSTEDISESITITGNDVEE